MSSEQPTTVMSYQEDKSKTEDQELYNEKTEGELGVYPAVELAEANDGQAKK